MMERVAENDPDDRDKEKANTWNDPARRLLLRVLMVKVAHSPGKHREGENSSCSCRCLNEDRRSNPNCLGPRPNPRPLALSGLPRKIGHTLHKRQRAFARLSHSYFRNVG